MNTVFLLLVCKWSDLKSQSDGTVLQKNNIFIFSMKFEIKTEENEHLHTTHSTTHCIGANCVNECLLIEFFRINLNSIVNWSRKIFRLSSSFVMFIFVRDFKAHQNLNVRVNLCGINVHQIRALECESKEKSKLIDFHIEKTHRCNRDVVHVVCDFL